MWFGNGVRGAFSMSNDVIFLIFIFVFGFASKIFFPYGNGEPTMKGFDISFVDFAHAVSAPVARVNFTPRTY